MRKIVLILAGLLSFAAIANPTRVTYAMPSGWVAAVRYVNPGETYGTTVNLYPKSGSYVFKDSNFYSFFTDPLADVIVPGATYAYVLEVLSVSAPCTFYMGQTDNIKAQLPWTSQEVSAPGTYILEMVAQPEQDAYDFLDRGMVIGKNGAIVDVTFRVSLFGGTGVTADNYSYVGSGKSLNVGAQALGRNDVAFIRWFDGDGVTVSEADVVTGDADVNLTAEWKVPGQGENLVALSEVEQAGLTVVVIDTEKGIEPTCDPLKNPMGLGTTSINAEKVKASMVIRKDGKVLYDSGAYEKDKSGLTIKVRGNTSSTQAKKPFKMKLQKKADLLFRGDDRYKDKEWLLLRSGYSYRYLVGWRMSELLGMPYTPQFEFVNVVINGDYRGMYLLCESVEQNSNCRIDVDKDDGFIFEYDGYYWAEDVSVKTTGISPSVGYTFKLPDPEDIATEQVTYISNVCENIEHGIADGTYDRYIEVNSWATWLLTQDCVGNGDYAGSNIYMAKYNRDENETVFMPCVWDLDGVMSRSLKDVWAPIHDRDDWFYFKALLNSRNRSFCNAYCVKWETSGVLAFDTLIAEMKELAASRDLMAHRVSRRLEKRRWGTSLYSAETDVRNTIQWLEHRKEWISCHIAEVAENVSRVKISFDANGGTCDDPTYVVTVGSTLGSVENLYPSASADNFSVLSAELNDNELHFAVDNRQNAGAAYGQAFTKPVKPVVPDMPFTYVVEVSSIKGRGSFYFGQTDLVKAQLPWANQMIDRVGTYVFHMQTSPAEEAYDFLDRMFVIVAGGEQLDIRFKVSLFAGNGVDATNYAYVAPGEKLPIGLPQPTRDGYSFKGWYYGDNRVNADTIVAVSTNFTLRAEWEKNVAPIKVTFDAGGGEVEEVSRYVKPGRAYSEIADIYPSDSASKFSKLTVNLADGVFSCAVDNSGKAYKRYFQAFAKPIDAVEVGKTYTYELEVLSLKGSAQFYTGRTDCGGYQLTRDDAFVDHTGTYAFTKKGISLANKYKTKDEYLDRLFFYVPAGVDFAIEYRVHLREGTVAQAALPVPVRYGYTFAGWYAGETPVEDDTVVDSVGDMTLTARWQECAIPVVVSFNANGGSEIPSVRYARPGMKLGETLNLYPSSGQACFSKLTVELTNNVFTCAVDNRGKAYKRYFHAFAKPIGNILPGEEYTYVLEVLSLKGSAYFYTGQTDCGGYQLSRDFFDVDREGVYVFGKTGRDVSQKYKTADEFLDRLFFTVPAGVDFAITYRISLYAGDEVTAENYSYVAPDAALEIGLPVPVRPGYVFKGWTYDGAMVDEQTVINVDTDVTLVAEWEQAQVLINEVMSNPSEGDDWVELYNPTGSDIDISGWKMIDSLTKKWKNWETLPADVVVPANGYLVIYCNKDKETGFEGGTLYLKVGLSSDGEAIALATGDYEADYKLAADELSDGWEFPALGADVSYGRDGEGGLTVMREPTPGSANLPIE